MPLRLSHFEMGSPESTFQSWTGRDGPMREAELPQRETNGFGWGWHPNLRTVLAIHEGMKDNIDQRSFTSALLLGVTAGLRSMTPPAALALAQQQAGAERIPLLNSPRAARALTTLALGEMAFDKLPFAPSRTSPGGLSGRLLSGGMCGAAVVPENQAAGALLGIAGALASSFVALSLRRRAGRASGLPDALIALVEDGVAIVLGIGAAALGSQRQIAGGRREFELPRVDVA